MQSHIVQPGCQTKYKYQKHSTCLGASTTPPKTTDSPTTTPKLTTKAPTPAPTSAVTSDTTQAPPTTTLPPAELNYEALIIACSVIGGLLVLGLTVCICCCCCCKGNNKAKYAKEDAKFERKKADLKSKHEDKFGQGRQPIHQSFQIPFVNDAKLQLKSE
ncbi:hypothetical protein MAR_007344, partial [Mya arenaria]